MCRSSCAAGAARHLSATPSSHTCPAAVLADLRACRAAGAAVVNRRTACSAKRRPCNKEEVAARAPQVISVNEAAREVTLYQSVGSKQLGRSFHFDKVFRGLRPWLTARITYSGLRPAEDEGLLRPASKRSVALDV